MAEWTELDFVNGAILTEAQLDQLFENTKTIVEFFGRSVPSCVTSSGGFEGATSANLTHSISAGTALVAGFPVVFSGTSHAYTASKDTYVDVDYLGDLYYSEVANGASEPSLASSRLRLMKVVTNGTQITSVKDLARRLCLDRETMGRSKDSDVVTVSNTVTETEFFKKTLPISVFRTPAEDETSRKIIIKVFGQYENSSGGSADCTVRLNWGNVGAVASTISELTFTDANHSTGQFHTVVAEFEILFADYCFAKLELGPPMADGTDPANSSAAATVVYGKNVGNPTNWTSRTTEVSLTVQHSVANTNTKFKFIHASIERV